MSETVETKVTEQEVMGKQVSSDDVNRVKTLRTKYAATTAQIGQVEIELHVMKKRLEDVQRIREELMTCLKHDTLKTLKTLNEYPSLRDYIFTKTNLWLKPTNEI